MGASAPLASQLFTVVFALAGLVSFALVLALVEQVILSLVEDNVTTGALHTRLVRIVVRRLAHVGCAGFASRIIMSKRRTFHRR